MLSAIKTEPTIISFRHSGTLALRAERQSAQMSETKNGRLGLYGIVWQFEELDFKGLRMKRMIRMTTA